MTDLIPVKRALLSVSDKTGLVDFARALSDEFGVALLSTGGTAKTLRDAGLPVTDVSDLTGFPEMMAGRVKTLHPKVHGAILGRLPEDAAVMAEHGIEPVDLVCVNLYPFEQTVAKPGIADDEAVENIDIGGPSMVRSAAKNHERVAVVVEAEEYDLVLNEMRANGGATTRKTRRRLAGNAFGLCSTYDTHIAHYLLTQPPVPTHSFDLLSAGTLGEKRLDGISHLWYHRNALRYGENPHQRAVLYTNRLVPPDEIGRGGLVASAAQLHGKALGYINLLDADAAVAVVREYPQTACCIVKHATPCGVGTGDGAADAFHAAYACDSLAAFGGIVAFNRKLDLTAAHALVAGQKFLEVIVAPFFGPDALELLKLRWKNVRLLAIGDLTGLSGVDETSFHPISGGLLVQERDLLEVTDAEWKVASTRTPTDTELAAMKFNWLACKHVKSNAVVVGGEHGTYGIGGGQVDRVAAAEQAVKKAGERAVGAVAASDAFFPFPDGPRALLDAGVTAIVQPGGSVKDQLTIDLVNERGAAMIFTGRRHFRH